MRRGHVHRAVHNNGVPCLVVVVVVVVVIVVVGGFDWTGLDWTGLESNVQVP